jgi:outer membrane usher protein
VFSGTVAASTAREDGAGTVIGAGFDKETGRSGFSLRAQWSSADFRLSGVDASNPLPRQQVAASAGYQFGGWGTASAGYVAQWFRSTPTATALRDNRFGSLGYSLQVAASATVSLTALRDFGQGGTTTLWAMLTIPWGAVYSASLGQTHRSGAPASRADDTELTLQRNLPLGDGYGYRVFARTPGDVQASLAVQREVGTAVAEVSRQDGIWAGRLGASGGIGYLGGHVFASREITESFGIVSVGDYPGVGILVDNQPAGRTDGSGYAVLPRLRPYDINLIGIEQRDLPLDAQVDRLAIDAVPYYRSGVLADFPVRRSRGATFTVRLDDGGLLPSGATIQVNGGTEAFPVALGGQAYVTGLDRSNRVRARWRNQDCEFDLPFPPTPDPLPDLGTFACRGVKP